MVTILCGVPGAGKSRLARTLCGVGPRGVLRVTGLLSGVRIVSADDYFVDEHGAYTFDPSKLPFAHGECLRNYVDVVSSTIPRIIVDNTNTRVEEIAPYAALALAYGHTLEIITLKCDSNVAHARNVHGVPFATIVRMAAQLDTRMMPPWWPHRIVEVQA